MTLEHFEPAGPFDGHQPNKEQPGSHARQFPESADSRKRTRTDGRWSVYRGPGLKGDLVELLQEAMTDLDADAGAIYELTPADGNSRQLMLLAAHGFDPRPLARLSVIDIEQTDRLFVDGICFAPDSAPVEPSTAKLELISTIKRESAIRSVIAALLTHNRRPIGCLLLGRYRVRRWQASEIEQIKVAADRLSAMFSSARASYQAADSVGQSSKGRKGELGISAGLLDTLLQNIPNGIVYLDQGLTIRKLNPAFAEYLNVEPETIIGRRCSQVFGQLGREIEELAREVLVSGNPAILDAVSLRSATSHFDYHEHRNLKILPVQNGAEQSLGVTIIVENLSQEEQIEHLRNEFLAIAAHELKTPLANIKAYAQLTQLRVGRLVEEPLHLPSAEIQRLSSYLVTVDEQVNRLTGLINELLLLSRLQTGQIEIHCIEHDLSRLVFEFVDRIRNVNYSHEIELQVHEQPIWVSCDANRLEQVLGSLLTNAQTYSAPGSTIRVSLYQAEGATAPKLDPAQRYAFVSVADSGVGIPPQELPHIFDRFHRGVHSDSRQYGGFGLGLYLAAEIVRRHNGHIWADSSVGQGSKFTFALPISK